MSTVEFIEYPRRADLVKALPAVMAEPDVIAVDVVDLGKTLRVERLGTVTIDRTPQEPAEAPEDADVAPATPEETADVEPVQEPVAEVAETPAEPEPAPAETPAEPEPATAPSEDEDLLGAPAEAKPEITSSTTRDELREIAEKFDLDVDIPTAGPLQPIRDRIAAALAD